MTTRELLDELAQRLAGLDDDTIEAWITLLREKIKSYAVGKVDSSTYSFLYREIPQ